MASISPNMSLHQDRKLTLEEVLADMVSDGLVSQATADHLSRDRPKGWSLLHPLVVVANKGWKSAKEPHQRLTMETMTMWLAERNQLGYKRIDPMKVDVAVVTKVMTHAYAMRFKILPIEVFDDYVVIATAEPFVQEWVDELSHVLRTRIERVVINPIDIVRYLSEFYGLSKSIRGASDEQQKGSGLNNLEQLVELGRSGQLEANDQHVVNIVDWLLQYAFDQRASDIHLEPRREQANVRFRIDGVLHLVNQMPTSVLAAVTSRIKAIGRMDVVERRRPQDGRVKTRTPNGAEVELRLSSMPTAFGEKLVMRIFDPEVLNKTPDQLGFSSSDSSKWQAMVGRPHGIVLVTGPTGSGKTTTLYATLKQLAKPEINLCTIEDPIEMVVPDFNQMQVQQKIDVDFASGVRTLLRQDPDIIMVGEIRDLETANMTVQASLTGHLVLSTLHTNSAPSAITRLLDIGVPPFLMNATLVGVVAQRLVRTLCPHCKKDAPLNEESWAAMVKPWDIPGPKSIKEPKGCLECRKTGFSGRTSIFEILTMTQDLRDLIHHECDERKLRVQAIKDGMEPLRISGARKVYAGLTSMEEVFKVAPIEEIL